MAKKIFVYGVHNILFMRVKVGNGPDLHNWNSFYPLYYTDTYNVNSDLKKKNKT